MLGKQLQDQLICITSNLHFKTLPGSFTILMLLFGPIDSRPGTIHIIIKRVNAAAVKVDCVDGLQQNFGFVGKSVNLFVAWMQGYHLTRPSKTAGNRTMQSLLFSLDFCVRVIQKHKACLRISLHATTTSLIMSSIYMKLKNNCTSFACKD